MCAEDTGREDTLEALKMYRGLCHERDRKPDEQPNRGNRIILNLDEFLSRNPGAAAARLRPSRRQSVSAMNYVGLRQPLASWSRMSEVSASRAEPKSVARPVAVAAAWPVAQQSFSNAARRHPESDAQPDRGNCHVQWATPQRYDRPRQPSRVSEASASDAESDFVARPPAPAVAAAGAIAQQHFPPVARRHRQPDAQSDRSNHYVQQVTEPPLRPAESWASEASASRAEPHFADASDAIEINWDEVVERYRSHDGFDLGITPMANRQPLFFHISPCFLIHLNRFVVFARHASSSFDDMRLKEELLRGIYAYGFAKPSAIQQRGILPIVSGRDTIAQVLNIYNYIIINNCNNNNNNKNRKVISFWHFHRRDRNVPVRELCYYYLLSF
jgi:hypothetical protein